MPLLPRRAVFLAIAAIGTVAPAAAEVQTSVTVEVNTATEAELDSVRGIGPDLNARIRVQRESRPFADWSDFIRRVKPMGPAKAQQLSQAGLRVGGRSYAAP